MSNHENLIPGPISPFWQDVDRVTMPALHRLGILNDTRAWHIRSIDPHLVDLDMVSITSGDTSSDTAPVYDQDRSLVHAMAAHIPQLARGHKEYTVFDVPSSVHEVDLFAGYVSRRLSDDEVIKAEIINYPFQGAQFRMLNATSDTYTAHFAVNNAGRQLPIEPTGDGMLGKHDQHRSIPLR